MHYRLKHHRLRARRLIRRWERRVRNHPRIVPIAAIAAIVFFGLVLAFTLRDNTITTSSRLDDANIVILHADDETRLLPTREKTVGSLLDNAGIILNEGDIVEPAADTTIEEDDFRINVYRAGPVVIEDQGKRIMTSSAATTSRSIADQAGVKVHPEDEIITEPSRDFLRDGIGSKVTINRSLPISLNLYGTPLPTRTLARTVGELLAEKQVVLAPDDTVQPAVTTPVTEGLQIFVTRHGVQVVTVEETIPMPIDTVEDNSLSFGTSAVRQKGSEGKKSITYQVEFRNGTEIGRTVIQEAIIQEPITQIVARGQAVSIPADHAKIMRAAGINESDFPYVEYIINHENGMWCATRWQGQFFCPPYYEEKFPGAETSTTANVGYGLCQATNPVNKMASAGTDWRTNPVTQLRWCSSYAHSRYGSWEAAYNSWKIRRWW